MDNYGPNRVCACDRCRTRGFMGPAVLVTLGVLLMVDEFTHFGFGTTWPILLIVIGLVKVLTSNASTQGHTDYTVNPPGPVPPPPPVPASTESSSSRQEQVDNV